MLESDQVIHSPDIQAVIVDQRKSGGETGNLFGELGPLGRGSTGKWSYNEPPVLDGNTPLPRCALRGALTSGPHEQGTCVPGWTC